MLLVIQSVPVLGAKYLSRITRNSIKVVVVFT